MRAMYENGLYPTFIWVTACAGLALKLPLMQRIIGSSWTRSIFVDVSINLASMTLRFLIVPVLLATYLTVIEGLLRMPRADDHPAGWLSVTVLSALFSARAEVSVLQRFFQLKMERSGFLLLSIANIVCALAGVYAAFAYGRAHPSTD